VKEKFKTMVGKLLGSRKFMLGLPTLILLRITGYLSGELFLAGFLALFVTNSYDKKKRMENGQPV